MYKHFSTAIDDSILIAPNFFDLENEKLLLLVLQGIPQLKKKDFRKNMPWKLSKIPSSTSWSWCTSVRTAVFMLSPFSCQASLLVLATQMLSISLSENILIIRAQLLTVPPYVCACINVLLSAYISDRFKRRGYVNAFNFGLAIIGFIILEVTNTPGARYVGTFFAATGAFPGIAITIAWNANNIQNSPTKRAVGIALQSSAGSFGGIIGSYMYSPFRFDLTLAMSLRINRSIVRVML